MKKYLKRKTSPSTGNNDASNNVIDVNDLPWDPSERPKIITYNPNQRDEIRRKYLWLEYSVKIDRAYYLPCYLSRDQGGNHRTDAFVAEEFILSALSLKSALVALFAKHGLSFTKVRGQDYDDARNMSGKFNGLKALILSDNDSAFYIHSFAHQLQLVVVAVARKTRRCLNISKMMMIMELVGFKQEIREFGDRFDEISTDLLQNMAALNPRNSFSQFNKLSLLKLSQMYPQDFEDKERIILEHELDIYYHSVYNYVSFANLNGIADLTRLMVATRKHLSHPLVYRLLKLTLVFPVATATVERCFLAMKFVKTDLYNRIGDNFFNFALICAIEKEARSNVKNEDVIDRFQNMKTRRGKI
ncbi:uncharacterized protein LOC112503001 [Cynara cardunculus var. scolymus]|uniref:uncharacterized protein LOC112503001 n=1 Tax=Cynara cardunculus var. scolymus TaxID=59895 RepID=UPI000D627013|nr:uncharacterized protein LOC112503001 [Cynara cardunculus var. scolymus]